MSRENELWVILTIWLLVIGLALFVDLLRRVKEKE